MFIAIEVSQNNFHVHLSAFIPIPHFMLTAGCALDFFFSLHANELCQEHALRLF